MFAHSGYIDPTDFATLTPADLRQLADEAAQKARVAMTFAFNPREGADLHDLAQQYRAEAEAREHRRLQ
ncbi:MAG: hypothetical protein AAB421_05125 [Patescibacteria group bacterium]